MRPTARLPFLVPTLLVTACQVVHPDLPPDLDDRLVVVAALNPDSTRHPVAVWPAQIFDTLTGAAVAIHRAVPGPNGSEWVLVGETSDVEEHWTACARRYGNITVASLCLVPTGALESGATYKVEVTAQGKDTAWGTTMATGEFEVDTAVLSGDAGDTLWAEWTRSVAAHRYIVSLRRILGRGNIFHTDTRGWYIAVDGTSVRIRVPEEALEIAMKPLTGDIAAFEVNLFSFITTGNGGSAFSVHPVQNVVGGFGVVGSVRYRSRPLTLKPN